ncbi:uncharacterized protein PV06_09184 [Exophiala oligosperma]|uniref:C2H2-type domain-containing protein n=1 Tax=Exophiala oligosperma TaxID=215243 RepID=A0A0D2D8G6_9EURO|nr:uncharacterized protein PV06_09184 [Exophiala oligosperma]KIW39413.1 hypothetical protein PV06_09184 [Exophiala oligosperma]
MSRGLESQHLPIVRPMIILKGTDKRWESNPHQSGATTSSANSVPGASFAMNISSDMNDFKPFICTQCSSSYTRRDLLARHVNSAHQQHNESLSSMPMIHLDASSFEKSNRSPILLASPGTAEATFDGGLPFTTTSSLHQDEPTVYSTQLNFDEDNTLSNNISEATNYFPPVSYDMGFVSSLDFNQFLMLSPLPSLAANSPSHDSPEKQLNALTPNSCAPQSTNHSTSSWVPLSAVPDMSASTSEQRKLDWAIIDDDWDHFVTTITQLCPEYAVSRLPSRQSISRYIAAYFRGFHEHLPFLHAPTINLHDTRPHLVVAIAMIGAQYCLDVKSMVSLFSLAKLMVQKGIDIRRQAFASNERAPPESGRTNADGTSDSNDEAIQSCQTLLLLMIAATWGAPKTTLKEDMNLQSILAAYIREEGLLRIDDTVKHNSWHDWIRAEGVKRTVLITFCFFNFHTILYNVPPPILNAEIHMVLPCCEEEWRCSTATSWAEEHAKGKNTHPEFGVAYKSLFHPAAYEGLKTCSSLGVYILITAIVQHIYVIRQLSKHTLFDHTTTIPSEIDTLHQALRRWQEIWEMDPHRSLGPNNPNGPLPFNSTALLRMAYVRLGMDIGSSFTMSSRNPQQIAFEMLHSPPVPRNRHSTRAALHAAHTLNTPVKIGLKLVAKTQALTWSLQHSLSYLESAFLLSKWLDNIMRSLENPPLDEAEQQVLSYVQGIFHEAVDNDDEETTPCINPQMSISLIRIWAQLILEEGIWPIVNMVGKTLALYADLLATNNGKDVA